MELMLTYCATDSQQSPENTLAYLMANVPWLAGTRYATTRARHIWLSAAKECQQSVAYLKKRWALEPYKLQIEESLLWEQHTPVIAKRPVLPRLAASISALLHTPYEGLGSLLIKSFVILEKMQKSKALDCSLALHALNETLLCWQRYNNAFPHQNNDAEEGLSIISACLHQCQSSKNEKIILLDALSRLIPLDADHAQKMAAYAHVLGFLFQNSTCVLFDSRKFFEAAALLFSEWILIHAQIVKGKDCPDYYEEARLFSIASSTSLEKLELLAIDCLWAQRGHNLFIHPHRSRQTIVIIGADSLASLTALIETVVAGYNVLAEHSSALLFSSKMIKIEDSSVVEALYRYGVAYRMLRAFGASILPASVNKFFLKNLFLDVVRQLSQKMKKESMSSFAFVEPNSLCFVPSQGLQGVDSGTPYPCKAIILAGKHTPESGSGVTGLHLRPAGLLWSNTDSQQINVAPERAFFLAGTKIAAFLAGGMEHQASNVDRDKRSIAITRYLPLFADHWGDSSSCSSDAVYQELCTASIERWLAQSYPVVFSISLSGPRLPRPIFIEKFLCTGMLNEYQANILRMLAIIADPANTTSFFEALPIGNASKIFLPLKQAICQLVNPEIDTWLQELTQLIHVQNKRDENDPLAVSIFREVSLIEYLIEYLKQQKKFVEGLLSDSPAVRS